MSEARQLGHLSTSFRNPHPHIHRSHRHIRAAYGYHLRRRRRDGDHSLDPLRQILQGHPEHRKPARDVRLRTRSPLDDHHRIHHPCKSQYHISETADDRSLDDHSPEILQHTLGVRSPSFLAGGDRSQTPPGVHIQTPPGGHNQRILHDGHIQILLDDGRRIPSSPHRTSFPRRSLRSSARSLPSAVWATGSCSSCDDALARETLNGACARRNLNDACQHRHPSHHPRYRAFCICYASSLPFRASCVPSFGASHTSLHRRNRWSLRLRSASWTYRVVWKVVSKQLVLIGIVTNSFSSE